MSDSNLNLFKFISNYVDLTDSDKIQLNNIISVREYEKGDVLIKESQVCKTLQFVVSGIYRVYKIEDGKEITSYFNYKKRNPFVASFVSLLTGEPSRETIECIESGELLTISYKNWKALYEKSHALNTFGRLMAEFNYVLAMERIESLQYHNATDRYTMFIKLYPNLLNLIPHHYIASYLGVTPESLSRIRKNSLKK